MKIDQQWECWTLCATKMKARTGGAKGRHLWPRLVHKIAEGKTSYEMSWKVKVVIKKRKRKASLLKKIVSSSSRLFNRVSYTNTTLFSCSLQHWWLQLIGGIARTQLPGKQIVFVQETTQSYFVQPLRTLPDLHADLFSRHASPLEVRVSWRSTK